MRKYFVLYRKPKAGPRNLRVRKCWTLGGAYRAYSRMLRRHPERQLRVYWRGMHA